MSEPQSDEDLADFISECRELIDEVAEALVENKDGLSHDVIHGLYRSLHTIKGSAQLFGFHQLSYLTQAMEGALEPVRDGTLAMPKMLPAHMIKATDVVSHLLDAIEQQKPLEGFDRAVEELVIEGTAIMIVAVGGGFVIQLGAAEPAPQLTLVPGSSDQPAEASEAPAAEEAPAATEAPAVSAESVAEPVAEPVAEATAQVAAGRAAKPKAAKRKEKADKQYEPGETSSKSSDSIRVQVSLLDHFMNLVGELVLTKNQVVDLARNEQSAKLRELSRDIAHVTSELQFLAMKTRLQPVGNVLTKFHRVVREIAQDLGKKVEFNLLGAQTELDRTLVEAIKDPITHIVRNALDHGIETPEEREKSGKTEPACLTIEAYYENGQVVVAIEDNGRGLNIDAIRAKAIDKQLISAFDAERLSDSEIVAFIFEPGFSTSAAVSSLSGRGVGMDVVKNNIEAIGGRVDVETELGVRTVFKLRIPLTMAIVSVMVVKVGGRPFAIPGAKIQELIQVHLDSKSTLDDIGGVPVYKLRGRLLPIIGLDRLLTLSSGDDSSKPKPIDCVVVVNTGSAVFGLAVDTIVESLDVVVKPIHPAIKQAGHFSGAAVLGDGKIALALDIAGLANYAAIDGLSIEAESSADAAQKKAEKEQERDFLIVRMAKDRRIAIPIDKIFRLEKFPADELKFMAGVASYTYRNKRIRIFDIREELGIPADGDPAAEYEIVMCKKRTTFFGVAVERIEDTFSTSKGFDGGWFDVPGVVGNLILGDETVVVVEPGSLRCVNSHSALAFVTQNGTSAGQGHDTIRLLLVEDSQFFRNQVKKVLEQNGFSCAVAEDGVEALAILSSEDAKHHPFQAVVSDIEMPRMDGLELARRLRQENKWQHLPLIAMTTRFRKKDQEAGFAAGFNEYLEKLNAKILLEKINSYTKDAGEHGHGL